MYIVYSILLFLLQLKVRAAAISAGVALLQKSHGKRTATKLFPSPLLLSPLQETHDHHTRKILRVAPLPRVHKSQEHDDRRSAAEMPQSSRSRKLTKLKKLTKVSTK